MITILLDADIVAYKVSINAEQSFDFNGDGDVAVSLDEAAALRGVDRYVTDYADKLGATNIIVCLTDPDANWRVQLNPTYKSNRKNLQPPALLGVVKGYLSTEYKSFIRPRLEADDVMGILATHPSLIEGRKIIVSEDKDMRTIPAQVFAPNRGELGVLEVSELDADRFHMWQTMVGDTVDGYAGARGIGPNSEFAEEIVTAPREDLWDIVIEAFASVGLTEDDAIMQARMARILRSEDYNLKTKGIRLWSPEKLYYAGE